MGVGHVKFSQVCFQHRGRGLLGLKNGHFLLKAKDPSQTDRPQDYIFEKRKRGVRGGDGCNSWLHFLAMLIIFCFFFRRSRDDDDVPTREEVDWETFGENGSDIDQQCRSMSTYLTLREKNLTLLRESSTHLTHYLPPIEHYFIPFAKAILRRLLSLQVCKKHKSVFKKINPKKQDLSRINY